MILDQKGWELYAEPKKKASVIEMKRNAAPRDDARPHHAANFLECVKTRQAPVENLDVGYHVSAVSQLGNVALRTKGRIEWDAAASQVVGNDAANALLRRAYRAPWTL
jgi:hypothetical protein